MSDKNIFGNEVSVDEQAFEKADEATVDEDGFEVVDETPKLQATVQMEVQAKVDANHPDGMVDTSDERIYAATLEQEERIRAREAELERISAQAELGTQARTILVKAQNAGVETPREPARKLRYPGSESGESDPDDQTTLEQAETITDHVSRVVFPAFSLDRGDGCEIHENAYCDLQTYLGLRERLAANEGARSFTYESTRERTPLGHSHREHIRDLSIAEIREMYRQAVNRLLSE
ncbi:MAG: hypothetical protein V5A60_05695, partial [Haloarculaceae archaeon]